MDYEIVKPNRRKHGVQFRIAVGDRVSIVAEYDHPKKSKPNPAIRVTFLGMRDPETLKISEAAALSNKLINMITVVQAERRKDIKQFRDKQNEL